MNVYQIESCGWVVLASASSVKVAASRGIGALEKKAKLSQQNKVVVSITLVAKGLSLEQYKENQRKAL